MPNLLIITPAQHFALTMLAQDIERGASLDQWHDGLREALGAELFAELAGPALQLVRVTDPWAPGMAGTESTRTMHVHRLDDPAPTTWLIVVSSADEVVAADRCIRGATLLYQDERSGATLLGDELGQLHLFDTHESVPAAEPHMVDDPRRAIRTLRPGRAIRPAEPFSDPESDGTARDFVYGQLRPEQIRVGRAIIWAAFDPEERRWYRGRRVEHVEPREPYLTG